MLDHVTTKEIQQALEAKYTDVMDLLVIDNEIITIAENNSNMAIMGHLIIGPYTCTVGFLTLSSSASIENDTAIWIRFVCIGNTYFKF